MIAVFIGMGVVMVGSVVIVVVVVVVIRKRVAGRHEHYLFIGR